MGRIIAIANQKGGVGKTTTSINLSASLAAKGKKVLVIDTDPQGNTTSGFGIEKNELENTIYELILGECSIRDCIISNIIKNVSVVPSNVNLAAAEIELIGVDKKEYILKNEVDYVKDDYDFIIIDCPPSLNMLTINSMTTADSVLVPIQCEYYALEGLSQLIHTINLVKERLNPDLRIDGVVFTMYDSRTNLDEDEINDYITEHFKGDCLLAVGDEELIKIHFHTNEPWKVLEYCASLGEIYDIVVEDMDRQSRGLHG